MSKKNKKLRPNRPPEGVQVEVHQDLPEPETKAELSVYPQLYDSRVSPHIEVVMFTEKALPDGSTRPWRHSMAIDAGLIPRIRRILDHYEPDLVRLTTEREELAAALAGIQAKKLAETRAALDAKIAEDRVAREASQERKAAAASEKKARKNNDLFVLPAVEVDIEAVIEEENPTPVGRVLAPPSDLGYVLENMVAKKAVDLIKLQVGPALLRKWREEEEAGKNRVTLIRAVDARLEELRPVSVVEDGVKDLQEKFQA